MLIIFIIIIILIIGYVISTYNTFVKLNNTVKEAFATMDVYLKKRWDLIPNVIETVKGYTKHEKETFKEIVELRNKSYDNMNTDEKVDVNNKLSKEITKLFALSEAYPDLKSSENFKDLTAQLSKVEEDIANSRKYYNATVKMMNDKILMFPSNVIASITGFKEQKMFEVDETERENVKVEF